MALRNKPLCPWPALLWCVGRLCTCCALLPSCVSFETVTRAAGRRLSHALQAATVPCRDTSPGPWRAMKWYHACNASALSHSHVRWLPHSSRARPWMHVAPWRLAKPADACSVAEQLQRRQHAEASGRESQHLMVSRADGLTGHRPTPCQCRAPTAPSAACQHSPCPSRPCGHA